MPGDRSPNDALDLVDYRRKTFDLYDAVRAEAEPEKAWDRWRTARDELFRTHPQSPLPEEERRSFDNLPYFHYDPHARVAAEVSPVAAREYDIGTSDGGAYRFTRFGAVHFMLDDDECELELYWLEGYGGGMFLPFRDATSGEESYGAGRYLLDTVKGADLGSDGDRLVLDFNFAYNPSCSYDPAWVCPLAPPPNWLQIPVRAGEQIRS